MAPLAADLRRELERAIRDARDVAETGAQNAMAVLSLASERAPDGLTREDRELRVALRAQSRSLGGGLTSDGLLILREEIAYAVWHRMLFARFLAENGLLIEPSSRAAVAISDVGELAKQLGEADPWVLAATYAADMLPGIFGTADPTTRVSFAPDDRLRLEAILQSLPSEVFTSDDALGWVYQFWQSKRKDVVNGAGNKIGGADLAPVTQLFTEHYMVRFLLENSLGAWWAGRHPESPLLRKWDYLRFRDNGTPAAGTFEGWPARAAEITVMDPCMGSGHFLVAAGDMLRRMRMEEEGLTVEAAAEAVLNDNLFGLELDPRCTQLGAFALAFDAWRAAGGYRQLPVPNIACSGIAVKGQLEDWRRLAGSDTQLRAALERLYDLFQEAPGLGSLIDPRSAAGEGLWAVDPEKLLATLDQALSRETEDPAAKVFGSAAQGTAKAARLLAGRYWLVATNPPFLGFRQMSDVLKSFVGRDYRAGRFDLASCFVLRCHRMAADDGGIVLVTPQNCWYLASYRDLRRSLLEGSRLHFFVRLGEGAFSSSAAAGAFVALSGFARRHPRSDSEFVIGDLPDGDASEKMWRLRSLPLLSVVQVVQLSNPDFRLTTATNDGLSLLEEHASSVQGLATGDTPRFTRTFWEVPALGTVWERLLSSPAGEGRPGGRSAIVRWEQGSGALEIHGRLSRHSLHDSHRRGQEAWGRAGVAIGQMRELPWSTYRGELFDSNVAVVVPLSPDLLPALTAFVSSAGYRIAVRVIDPKVSVTNATLVKVPFDLEHWTKVAAEKYPNGLPEPHSDDPTQWLFEGNIVGSEAPLQVAVARLLGYRWPDQAPDELDAFADLDGIVCLPPVIGEAPAAERLEKVLVTAYGADWSAARRGELLAAAGGKATTLEAWLRDEFFEQHARVFHNRPFAWHVWDGRPDGFSALLDYHRLDRATLEKLAYAQLGDWIERQREAASAGEVGAGLRLAAATELQRALVRILEGEKPYDIYVRWKSLAEQPIGWEPDLDDGVRLNIRPFVLAGILRARFTINWNKDRGKDPDGAERPNDRHLSLAEKRAARGGSA